LLKVPREGDSNDLNVQVALRVANEKNLLRGRKLMNAKSLIEQRPNEAKDQWSGASARLGPHLTPSIGLTETTQTASRI
jgi:hypothetical protein